MGLMSTSADPIAVLDLGSHQTRVVIAEAQGPDEIKILASGQCMTRGVAKGIVNNAEFAQQSIADALAQAENLAGISIRRMAVSVNTANLSSVHISLSETLNGQHVTPEVRERLAIAARHEAQARLPAASQWHNLHMIPLGFSLDGDQPTDAPDGLSCQTLVARYHLVHAPKTYIDNLKDCLWNNNIDVETFVLAPYAAGMSALKHSFREFGATLVDLGAETTSVVTFQGWKLQRAVTLAVGSHHITGDVARHLGLNTDQAERLKVSQSNLSHTFDAPTPTETAPLFEAREFEHTDLNPVVEYRLREILDAVDEVLTDPRFALPQTPALVFTGAGANLRGFGAYADKKFSHKRVQLAAPAGIDGAPEDLSNPSFATALGLVRYMAKWRAQRAARRGTLRGLAPQALPFLGRLFAN